MSGSAKITSIDAVESFRIALLKFNDNASRSLTSVDEQIKRVLHWFEHDAPMEWGMRIRKGHEEVARTRAALETCRSKKVGDHRPSCMEEQQALREAQQKLAHAQKMLEVIKLWANRVRQASDDYRGGVMGLKHQLDVKIPETAGMLSRTVRALDAYVERARENYDNSSAGTSPSKTTPTDSAPGNKS